MQPTDSEVTAASIDPSSTSSTKNSTNINTVQTESN
jgi:hypothetical protein